MKARELNMPCKGFPCLAGIKLGKPFSKSFTDTSKVFALPQTVESRERNFNSCIRIQLRQDLVLQSNSNMTSFNLFGQKISINNDTVKYMAVAMLVFYFLRIVKYFVEKREAVKADNAATESNVTADKKSDQDVVQKPDSDKKAD